MVATQTRTDLVLEAVREELERRRPHIDLGDAREVVVSIKLDAARGIVVGVYADLKFHEAVR